MDMSNGESVRVADRAAAALLEQVARAVYEDREAGALFPAQWAALRYFQRAGYRARTVRGLATYLGVTRGPASRTAGSLVRRGLLNSEADPQDRRVTIFTMTPAGRNIMETDPLGRLAGAIASLDRDRRPALIAALEEIYAGLRANSGNRGG